MYGAQMDQDCMWSQLATLTFYCSKGAEDIFLIIVLIIQSLSGGYLHDIITIISLCNESWSLTTSRP